MPASEQGWGNLLLVGECWSQILELWLWPNGKTLLVFCVTQCLVFFHSCISYFFLCSGKLSDKSDLEEGRRADCSSHFEDTVHQGREGMVALPRDSGSVKVLLTSKWLRTRRQKVGQAIETRLITHYRYLSVRPHLLHIPQHLKTAPPAGNQMNKYISLWGIFHIQTTIQFQILFPFIPFASSQSIVYLRSTFKKTD